MKKWIKRITLGFLSTIILLFITILIMVNMAPQFGKKPHDEHLEKISESSHYSDGNFQNLIKTNMDMSLRDIPKTFIEFFTAKEVKPKGVVPVDFNSELSLQDSVAQVTWYGHSAIKIQIDGKTILIDPMLGDHASPFSFFGRRFEYKNAIPLEDLDHIDAIIISHDHYDHLDYNSIKLLAPKTNQFFTPLGVGSHLQHWGIDASRITELDWWESAEFESLTFTATPARHFSGRSIGDRNKTQWAGWAIQGSTQKIFFSGDSGYGPHFKEIGDKLGPFDFVMMECGQYNEKWEAIHMFPEQSLKAFTDVRGSTLMPIHWGAFNLSVHKWTDPVERLFKSAEETKANVITPVIGKPFNLNSDLPESTWWKK